MEVKWMMSGIFKIKWGCNGRFQAECKIKDSCDGGYQRLFCLFYAKSENLDAFCETIVWGKHRNFAVEITNKLQSNMEYMKLSNGVEMPTLGYGVFLVSPDECERCVTDALSVGYRLIDTAQAKVWISNAGEEKAAKSIDESLRKLQTEYIDLLLIHQAYGDVFGTWRAMEKAYRAGKVRAIGVSNFQAGRFFDFAHYVEVKPMVNQLQCNTLIQQTGIEPIHAEFGTKMMAWGPLGGQGVDGIVKSDLLAAIGAKYGKSAAQVALRWLTQRGIVAIPKSTHKERMEQNFDIFDFTLTDDEMAKIATMNQHDTGTVNFGDPSFVKYDADRAFKAASKRERSDACIGSVERELARPKVKRFGGVCLPDGTG